MRRVRRPFSPISVPLSEVVVEEGDFLSSSSLAAGQRGNEDDDGVNGHLGSSAAFAHRAFSPSGHSCQTNAS